VPQIEFKPETLSYSYLVLPAFWNFYHVSYNFKTNYHNTNASGIFSVGGTPVGSRNTNASGIFSVGGTPVGSRNSQRIPNDLCLPVLQITNL